MSRRRKRFELMVFEADRHRLLVGDDIGKEGARDLFLCLPGLLETRKSFDDFVTHMSPHARIMTLDWCGRGDSQKLSATHEYRMSVYLSDLSLFYSHALGAVTAPGKPAARIHLVGTSMGGLLAMFLASHKPQHLGVVVLNDIGPVLPWGGVFSLMTGLTSASSADRSADLSTFSGFPDVKSPDLAQRLNVDPQLLRAIRHPSHLDLPHENRLWGVDFSQVFMSVIAPLMLLRGMKSDIINNSVVDRIFELHPLTEIYDCEECGHPVPYTADVCQAILKFVAEH
jgi:pimeloyl-ACP methyl ester carboxylesterase